MSHTKKAAGKQKLDTLEDRIHEAYHFLHDWSHLPDADTWLQNYLSKAINLLYPKRPTKEAEKPTKQVLKDRILETMQYLLETGMERRENKVFQFHVMVAIGLLQGIPYDGPIYYREAK